MTKMRFLTSVALILTLGTPVVAEVCPPNKDILEAETALFQQIRVARTGTAVAPLSNQLWQLWTQAPDDKAQTLLDDGMHAIRLGDFGYAAVVLDELIAYCPDYAEGYNQRGFAHYLQFESADALTMLDAAEARAPRHLGVLTGKALTFVAMDDIEAAQDPLRKAVRLNPWLSERALLLEPMGEEL